jgi:hypothetical protein
MIEYVLGIIIAILVLILIFYLISKSKGKIILDINKSDFIAGETIKGMIKLNLKKLVEAESLNISLVGIMKSSGYSTKEHGSSSRVIFDSVKKIDGKKTYNLGESNYDFEFKIPENLKINTGNQILDRVVKSVQFIAGQKIYWYLTAYLDIKGFDLKKKVRVYIN